MATYSSGESSKPHSPQRAFFLGESKEAKISLAQQHDAISQLEERLQRLEVTNERSNHSNHGSRIIDILQEALPTIKVVPSRIRALTKSRSKST